MLDSLSQAMDGIKNTVTTGTQDAIASTFQTWLVHHPVLAWMMSHPLWALVLVAIALLVSWGLLGAIAQFIQQVWLWILQSPLKLIRFLFSSIFALFQRSKNSPTVEVATGQQAYGQSANHLVAADFIAIEITAQSTEADIHARLSDILNRLEALRQEQEALLAELRSLLATQPQTSEVSKNLRGLEV